MLAKLSIRLAAKRLIVCLVYKEKFYDNCRNSRAYLLIVIVNYAMRQGTRADNLTICYRKKRTVGDCPGIDNEVLHNIVKVVCRSYFDNVMTKFMINNRTDA